MPDRSSIIRWLEPPESSDQRSSLAIATVHAIGWTMGVCGVLALAVGTVGSSLPLDTVMACLSMSAVGLGSIVLVRSGAVRLAGLLVTVGGFAIVALEALHAGYVLPHSSVGFVAVVTIAGLTVGGRAGIAAACTSIVFMAVLGRWPLVGAAPRFDPSTTVLPQGILLLFVAALLYIARDQLDRAFSANTQREQEIEARNRELASERERFRVLSENSQHLITEMDLEGNVRYASPNHAEVLGWTAEELVGLDWRNVIHPEDVAFTNRATTLPSGAGKIPPTTYRVRHRDGSVRWLESAGQVFNVSDGSTQIVSVTRDVTERVALETQLRQSQKLEAVGRLAGGVAHDFNNLLTVINGYSEMLLEGDGFADKTALREIYASGKRAQALTRQLLMFSRRQALRPRVLDLDEALCDVESLLLRLLGEHIALSVTSSPEALNIFIDSAEFEQVVVNLALNARDAMPEGGRIEISTRLEEDRDDSANGTNEAWAVLEVRDEGVGMSTEELSHVFEPFYTTKDVGEGTGLGLAMVHGIVEQSGGHVKVESAPGVGTCFRVYLRQVSPAEFEEPVSPVEAPSVAGRRTILVAEDEPAVRRLVRDILTEGGYRVLEAATGLEALSMLQPGAEAVDLLLSDVVMPEMGGPALAAELAEIRPHLPVVFMSGYPDGDRDKINSAPLPSDRVIDKPFTRNELLSIVHTAIEGESSEKPA